MNGMDNMNSRKSRADLHSQAPAIRLQFQRCFEYQVKDRPLTLQLRGAMFGFLSNADVPYSRVAFDFCTVAVTP